MKKIDYDVLVRLYELYSPAKNDLILSVHAEFSRDERAATVMLHKHKHGVIYEGVINHTVFYTQYDSDELRKLLDCLEVIDS